MRFWLQTGLERTLSEKIDLRAAFGCDRTHCIAFLFLFMCCRFDRPLDPRPGAGPAAGLAGPPYPQYAISRCFAGISLAIRGLKIF